VKKKIEKQDMQVEEEVKQGNILNLIDRYKNLSPEILNELKPEIRNTTKSGTLNNAVYKSLVEMEENQIELNVNNILFELALSEGKAFKRDSVLGVLSNLIAQNKIYSIERGHYAVGENPNPKRTRKQRKLVGEEPLDGISKEHNEIEHERDEEHNEEDLIYG